MASTDTAASAEPSPLLPPAPDTAVTAAGEPAFGAYQGHLRHSLWDGLRGRHARSLLWRFLHAKRWHYVSIAGPEVVLACLVADLGWTAAAFAYVFDRRAKRLLCDHSFLGIQKVTHIVAAQSGESATTTFRGLSASIRLERPKGSRAWRLQAEGPGGFVLDATLDASSAPPTLCAIAPITDGVANATHKTVSLPASGVVRVGGARFELSGHAGALDHTSGLLARDTSWRWASASGKDIGLNLVEGFNGPVENALWHEGRLYPVGEATFEFDKEDHLKPWRIRTRNGMVDLGFQPEGARREDKDLFVAQSFYVQPIGVFSGTVRPGPGARAVEVRDLAGVTEDHVARW